MTVAEEWRRLGVCGMKPQEVFFVRMKWLCGMFWVAVANAAAGPIAEFALTERLGAAWSKRDAIRFTDQGVTLEF